VQGAVLALFGNKIPISLLNLARLDGPDKGGEDDEQDGRDGGGHDDR